MKTALTFSGIIFLIGISIPVAFLLLAFLRSRWVSRNFPRERYMDAETSVDSSSFVLDVLGLYSKQPIIGKSIDQSTQNFARSLKEASQYLKASMPEILEHWDSAVLINKSTQQFLESANGKKLASKFESHRHHLGPFKAYDDIMGFAENNCYLVRALFKKSDAYIQVQLVQNESTWLINNFKVNYKTEQVDWTEWT